MAQLSYDQLRFLAAMAECSTKAEAAVAEFRRGVRILCGQVRQLGAEPLWEPPLGEDDD